MAPTAGDNVAEHEATAVDIVIASYFTEAGEPYVEARLILPRLNVAGPVVFLVDTGAVSTVLHSDTAKELACPFDRLVLPVPFEGVGGLHTYYRELALVRLDETREDRDIAVEIAIAKPGSSVDGLDSLLGRDVLNRLRMEYDFPQGLLGFL